MCCSGGLESIRAYRLIELLTRRFERNVDQSTSASYHIVALQGWLRMRLLFISVILVGTVAFLLVGLRSAVGMTPMHDVPHVCDWQSFVRLVVPSRITGMTSTSESRELR